jgi:dihydrodipicolinate synthase/N-acetylneuraminate lyase
MGWRETLREGVVIPAHPLALTAARKLDERRQRALTRYYRAAGAGGVAVGVHTTQFAIRDVGLYQPVLEIAAEEVRDTELIKVAGVVGHTPQAVKEAECAASLGYHAALLSLGALRDATIPELLEHTRTIAQIMPVFGFYLQPAVGGRVLPYEFWRGFAEIENVVAVKIAPFNRYQTIDVVRAIAESGRAGDIALYTGNDDNIMVDLLTPFVFGGRVLRIRGGLLGQWAVWTFRAVQLVGRTHAMLDRGTPLTAGWLTKAAEMTYANAVIFDAANNFRGCIPGIHEVLVQQGILSGRWCLDPEEDLSPGQGAAIARLCKDFDDLPDDNFVKEHLHEWLR